MFKKIAQLLTSHVLKDVAQSLDVFDLVVDSPYYAVGFDTFSQQYKYTPFLSTHPLIRYQTVGLLYINEHDAIATVAALNEALAKIIASQESEPPKPIRAVVFQ